MNFSSRFFLYGPFALFVAFAASVMIYWWVAAVQLSHRLDAANGHAIAPGVTIHFASKTIGGFPFRLDAVFEDFTVTAAGARGPIAWHSDRFATHTLTYAHDVTILEATGRQELRWTGESGARRSFVFTPGALRASAVVDKNALTRFDLDIISLAAAKFAAGRAQFHIRRDPTMDALDLVIDLQSIRFAGDAAAGFANGLSHARIEGRLAPTAPFAGLFAGRAQWDRALDAWRTAPGIFKVDQAAVFWNKCEATSAGALTLDEQHHFAGSLAFSLADCDALAKEAASVTTRARTRRAILAVLADLASREPADRSGALPITVVFKDGLVFVGPGRALGNDSYFEPVALLHAVY